LSEIQLFIPKNMPLPSWKAFLRPKTKGQKRVLSLSLFAGSIVVVGLGLIRSNLWPALPSRLCIFACQVNEPVSSESAPEIVSRPSLLAVIGNDFEAEKVSVRVEKSAYRLSVLYEGQAVRSYPIVLGGAPVGDKRAEGDRKTPEGIYRVRDLYPHPGWSKFIWLDYPTEQDVAEHEQAKRSGELPANATVGGEIGIHGVPRGADDLIDSRTNWTLGCISLKNADVDEIYEVMRQGTLIEVLP
jgi:murein L,D-transpeptidase YafK